MTRYRIPLLAGTAGALLVSGALLPWVTLFAGLQTMPGTTGTYGRLVLAGGIGLLVLALVSLRVHHDVTRWVSGILGGLLLLPAGLALIGQRTLAAADPMLIAAAGPGPWVAVAGAAMAFTALFLRPAVGETPVRTSDRVSAEHLSV